MSNPGPAVTVSLHPQNVTSGQTLRLLASAKGVNANQTGDTLAAVINSSTFMAKELVITNANNAGATANLASTVVSIWTGASATGTSLFGNVTANNCSTTSGVNYVDASSTASSQSNLTNLYVHVNTASGVTGTVDVYVYGYDFSQTF